MTVAEALKQVHTVRLVGDTPPVVETALAELFPDINKITVKLVNKYPEHEAGCFDVYIGPPETTVSESDYAIHKERLSRAILFSLQADGCGTLYLTHACYFYAFMRHILDDLTDDHIDRYQKTQMIQPAFFWNRATYDYFLTQAGRIQKGLSRETYIRELARQGFTHIEVNGLAYPMSLETGPEGETYPMFYTHCPALDQFVSSELNRGLYPDYYLSANLVYLKENARLAAKYGLTPGLLCFEPRSVPERFFDKYPMLRGARVDHPFRSFKPRYNMTIAHPLVRDHYAEMTQKLLDEVPELGFISIWTNDSGAGFEHTKSLYVGRNGGPYLIREWKDDAEIARVAGENALLFLKTLRDAGKKINPEFRVMTRLESFYGEHDVIWEGLGEDLDVEAASLISRGWDIPYNHPKYPDSKSINAGSVYQNYPEEGEKVKQTEIHERGSLAHFYFTAGPHIMFEPLLGVPYPNLTFQRLKLLHGQGIDCLSNTGGTCPPELVPYNINHEITRLFQFNPQMDGDEALRSITQRWAGKFCQDLMKAWRLTEEAILAFPNVSPLYSTHGFTWYRLWVRPFVPNLEAISEEERRYYEDFMCTTPHNPNNVDLSRDVLFQLTTPEKSRLDVERMDQHVWEPIDQAIELLGEKLEEAEKASGENNVIEDQFIRLKALRCWLMTQRNVAAWIAGVYGYMDGGRIKIKQKWREFLQDMMKKEIANTDELLSLLETGIEFMAMTEQGETPLIHGTNFRYNLEKRIALMELHFDDEPFIDHDYMLRKSADSC
ncbi:hypothetical protein KJ564_16875 [bacterium]|nr:hypothetical protein [bacterium]